MHEGRNSTHITITNQSFISLTICINHLSFARYWASSSRHQITVGRDFSVPLLRGRSPTLVSPHSAGKVELTTKSHAVIRTSVTAQFQPDLGVPFEVCLP